MSSYKYNSRLSSSPKVVGVHVHEHSGGSTSSRNSVKGAIKIKQRPRSTNIRLQPDFDGYSDSSDSTNCSELSNASTNISSYHQNRKNSVNSYSGRSISNNSTISKRTSIAAKRTSLNTDRPPIPIKNNNIMKKVSMDSSNYDPVMATASPDKKLLAISINDQANDRALRKIMDLEILNESLRSVNESLECTVKEQSLKMEQLQLQIDHLKSASSLNSTADDDLLFDFLLTKDTNSDSEIKIIPRHPQHANKNSTSSLSSSIPKPKEVENILNNNELNEDIDIQFKRICAKLEFLINDATKAIDLKPKELEKELNKEKGLSTSDPNTIKIERRHSSLKHESSHDKNSFKITDSNTTLVEEEEEEPSSSSTNNNTNEEEDVTPSISDLKKIDEEVIQEKSPSENKEEKTKSSPKAIPTTTESVTSAPSPVVVQSYGEIQTKYKKVFNMLGQLNTLSKDVMNETQKFETAQHHSLNPNEVNKSPDDSNSSTPSTTTTTTPSSNANKGLAMLLNPLLNYTNTNSSSSTTTTSTHNTPTTKESNSLALTESSTHKIKELTHSMNQILENLMEVLKEEKEKELKQSEEHLQNKKRSSSTSSSTSNGIRCPIVLTSAPPEKPNKTGFNRRNSSVTSPKFNRTSSVEHSISVGSNGDVLNNESMRKINAILNSNGNSVVNAPGYPSILSSIPFKKENKLFHRTRTWDPQYLNHYRSLSVQTPSSSLRNVASPSLGPAMVSTSTSASTTTTTTITTTTDSSKPSTSTTPLSSKSPKAASVKPSVNEEEMKFQTFVQGLERKKTHLPSFYL